MDSNKINISSIETFFYDLLNGKASDNVFVSYAPLAINKKWKDFIVVDCDGISDWNAYGRGIVLLYIYVPSMGSSGKKNVAQFASVERKLNEAIKNNDNPNYGITRQQTYSDYDEDKKMFVDIIELNLVVLT